MSTTHAVTSADTTVSPATRAWAVTGFIAALAAFASVFLSMMLSPEYVRGSVITAEAIDAALQSKLPVLIAFHVTTLGSALLLVVFAAGLHRRLCTALPAASLAPTVALSGLLLVAVAQVLGSGLDTEFLFGIGDRAINLPGDIGLYSHWIATIPWLWVGGGLAAVAVGAASRRRAVPMWIGIVGFILGALTLLLGLSPLQYMAAGPGALWLLVTSLGFIFGDRDFAARPAAR